MKSVCFLEYDMSVIGGVEQVTANLVNGLADYYDIHLICLFNKNRGLAYNLDPRVKCTILYEDELRLSQARKTIQPLLKKYFKENKIDVAILQENYTGFICSGHYGKTKVYFCEHGALANQWSRKDIVFIKWFSSFICSKTIVLTERSRRDYMKRFLLPPWKLAQIYNWIDIPREDTYNASSKHIIAAGRLGKEKGFDMLIDAFAPVAKKHPDWTLDIYGDGEMMPVVKEKIEEYCIGENVVLHGMVQGVAEKLKEGAFLVLSSYREGLPIILLEAKCKRIPIISFDVVTGPSEIVRDGVDGILIPPYDIEKMSQAMCRLIEDDKLRQSMSDNSQGNLDKFSKDEIIREWQKVIG